MKALCWRGKQDIRYETVPDPEIEDPGDAVIKMTSCAICGSDLHLFGGFMPGMKSGDIMGHESGIGGLQTYGPLRIGSLAAPDWPRARSRAFSRSSSATWRRSASK